MLSSCTTLQLFCAWCRRRWWSCSQCSHGCIHTRSHQVQHQLQPLDCSGLARHALTGQPPLPLLPRPGLMLWLYLLPPPLRMLCLQLCPPLPLYLLAW